MGDPSHRPHLVPAAAGTAVPGAPPHAWGTFCTNRYARNTPRATRRRKGLSRSSGWTRGKPRQAVAPSEEAVSGQ